MGSITGRPWAQGQTSAATLGANTVDGFVTNLAVGNMYEIEAAKIALDQAKVDAARKEAEVVAIRQAGKTLAGPVDHRVPMLAARSADGALVGLVFGYACHATTLSFDKWCADYPGYACESLEKSNPGAVCAFMAGCGLRPLRFLSREPDRMTGAPLPMLAALDGPRSW